MKRLGVACGIAAALFVIAGCNDYGNTFQVPTGASITALSPATVSAGSQAFTLTVTGNFTSVSTKTVVQWNNTTIPTTVTTDSAGNITTVTAQVAASLVAKQGTAFVNTLSPHSGSGTNGLSNVLAFVINPPPNPTPSVTSISPTSAPAGSPQFTLTINGSNFLSTSAATGVAACGSSNQSTSCVNWNMGATQTTFTTATPGASMSISSSTISLTIPASFVATTGCAVVTVFNPPSAQTAPAGTVPNPAAGGGGTSLGQPFTVGQPSSPCTTSSATAATQSAVAQETPAVSADGRYVAYSATQNEHSQIFLHDTCEGAPSGCQPQTQLISSASDGTVGNDDSHAPSMSSDGRYVAFSSAATNLVTDAPAGRQVYVRDTCSGATAGKCTPSTQLVSTDTTGMLTGTESILPSVSASGRFVAFLAVTPSHASNKNSASPKAAQAASPAANSGFRQVFVRDTCVGVTGCTPKTTRISLSPGDTSNSTTGDANAKPAGPAVSGQGQHVGLPDAATATFFTHGTAIDDQVFLALTKQQ